VTRVRTVGDMSTERVSLREVKEEIYRALRKAGYSWGVSTAAGRVAAAEQVLWGTGVLSILGDVTRWRGSKRQPVMKDRTGERALDSRGAGHVLTGLSAFVIAAGRPEKTLHVRGVVADKEWACVAWDIHLSSGRSFVWDSTAPGQAGAHSVNALGDLVSHPEGRPLWDGSGPKGRGSGVSYREVSGGETVLAAQERTDALREALTSGVVVDSVQWSTLMANSRKFLVPE